MKISIAVSTAVFLLALLLSPILIFQRLNKGNVKYKFIIYLVLVVFVTSAVTFAFAWWTDISNNILLKSYGYNFDGMNSDEKLANVSSKNVEEVKILLMRKSGIGWPLKAMMTYELYSPYILVVYLIGYLVIVFKKRN